MGGVYSRVSEAEAYFNDLRTSDVEPIPCHTFINNAPDEPLRRMGIIRQQGMLHGKLVEFDPRMPGHGTSGSTTALLHAGKLGRWAFAPPAPGLARKPVLNASIFVNTPQGNTVTVEVEVLDTVGNVRAKVQDMEDIQADERNGQCLTHDGKELDEGQTLEECGIQRGATLKLAGSSERSGSPPNALQDRHSDEETSLVASAVKQQRGPTLVDRADSQPTAVVRIVGSVSYNDFSVSVERSREIEGRAISDRLRLLPGMEEDLPSHRFDAQRPNSSRRRSGRRLSGGTISEALEFPESPTAAAAALSRRTSIMSFNKLVKKGKKKGADAVARVEEGGQAVAGLEMKVRRFLKSSTVNDRFATTGFRELVQESESSGSEADKVERQPEKPEEQRAWRRRLKPHQVAKFVRQYLQRSIPEAADCLGALVIVNEPMKKNLLHNKKLLPGDLTRSLNRGFYGMSSPEGGSEKAKRVKKNEGRGVYVETDAYVRPALLCVHSLPRETDPADPWTVWHARELHVGAVCDTLSNFTHHLFLWGERGPANRQGVLEYTSKMVDTLARGNARDPSLDARIEQHPDRAGASVCTILFGGDEGTAQIELMRSVASQWPILVVEGSLGYADVLARHIRSVEELVGAPSMDDFKRYLGKADPNTRAVITSGLVKIIPKGTPADEVSILIQQSLTPDETLHMAWSKYALWDYNAWVCRKQFMIWQVIILSIGIVAIALSVTLTYLQLQYPNETGVVKDAVRDQSGAIPRVYDYIGIVVVILPVGLSLAEAIQSKLNSGGRWVDLRSASETMLREIYMYRTHTGPYSLEKIAESQRTDVLGAIEKEDPSNPMRAAWQKKDAEIARRDQIAVDQTQSDGNSKAHENFTATDSRGPYKTREEKLNFWIESLIETLKDASAAQSTLRPYRGPLPPYHIQDSGDDGWRDLAPQEYVEYRLRPLLIRYQNAARVYERRVKFLNIANYGLGAAGTLLAALSSLSFLATQNLQAWVALTTGISNAITRYVDYTRLEFLQKKGNDVSMKLTNVQSWWEGRSTGSDGQATRNDLVNQVEELITGEFLEWGGQMKKAMQRQKKEKGDLEKQTAEMTEKLRAGEDLEQVKKIKEMGLENLNSKTLTAALLNPTGPEASKVFESVNALNERVEESTGVNMKEEVMKSDLAKEAAKQAEVLKTTSEKFLDGAGNLLDVNLGGIALSDFVPADLKSFVQDPKARKKIFRDISKMNISSLTRSNCLEFFNKGGDAIRQKVSELSQRQMLEVLKSTCVQQLEEQLVDALKSINVTVYDVVPAKDRLADLLMELKDLEEVPWREMQRDTICELVKDSAIRAKFQALNEVTLRGLLKRADKVVGVANNEVAGLLYRTFEQISALDTADLFSDPHVEAEMFDVIDNLTEQHFGVSYLAKEEILSKLPAQVRDLEVVKRKTQAQLAQYLTTLKGEYSVARIFRSYLSSVDQENVDGSGNVLALINPLRDPVMDSLVKNRRLSDRFVYAARSVHQSLINKSDRSALMKKLQASPALSADMLEELRFLKKETLQHVMSGVKALVASTYQGRVFDSLCDDVSSLDLRNLIPDGSDRERLVKQVREFVGADVSTLSKKEIIARLSYKSLVLPCLKLTEPQLRELIGRALSLMGSEMFVSLFTRTTKVLQDPKYESVLGVMEDVSPGHFSKYKAELQELPTEIKDRICVAIIALPQDLTKIILDPALLQKLKTPGEARDDPAAQTALRACLDASLTDSSVLDPFKRWNAVDLWILLSQVRSVVNERVSTYLFESCVRHLSGSGSPHASKFRDFFYHPILRQLFLDCLIPLARTPMSKLEKMPQSELLAEMTYIVGGYRETQAGYNLEQVKVFLSNFKLFFESVPGSLDGSGGGTLDPAAEGAVKKLVLMVLSEVTISTPYHMFLKLAQQISAFNLRDLIDDPRSRRLLPVLVLRCFHSDDPATQLTIEKEDDGAEVTIELKSGKEMLDAMDEFTSGQHLAVVNNMRLLSKEQCKRLVFLLLKQFKDSQVGQLFSQIVIEEGSAGSLTQSGEAEEEEGGNRLRYETLMEVVSSLKGHMQLAPDAVSRDLRKYDASQFFAVYSETQRLEIIRKYVPEETSASAVSRANQESLAELFAHLKALPYSSAASGLTATTARPRDTSDQGRAGAGRAEFLQNLERLILEKKSNTAQR
eukprot:Hpha_TRINITY_DN16393_c4_g1::TRINITY_DN16393_c4_g1_i1::g.60181::m.60181